MALFEFGGLRIICQTAIQYILKFARFYCGTLLGRFIFCVSNFYVTAINMKVYEINIMVDNDEVVS